MQVATKQSSTHFPHVGRVKRNAANPDVKVAQVVSTGKSDLQTKTCPCGGGCPRCTPPWPIQAKLPVSDPGDQYEQEADRVAEQVMRTSAPTLQGQWRRQTNGNNHESASAHAENHGPGQLLDAPARNFFAPRFGHDFSDVRVHTDAEAEKSARQFGALAYTIGRDIFLPASSYQPETNEGRHLLAHELTHVLQQSGNPGTARVDHGVVPTQIQRQADPDASGPCDQTHTDDLIEPAFTEARRWRSTASQWLEEHLNHIRQRASVSRDNYVRIGQRVFDELRLLERHFRISSVLRVSLPYSADDLVSIDDLQRYANASYWVRRRFDEVDRTPSYLCQTNCPRGRTGSDVLGSANAGLHEVIFYTMCFDQQHETTRAGVALHEAFHASFREFDHDTYSFESSYPGSDGLTNAESFAMFAAVVTTGGTYRITILPGMTIHGNS
jgi:hypothetical protein